MQRIVTGLSIAVWVAVVHLAGTMLPAV